MSPSDGWRAAYERDPVAFRAGVAEGIRQAREAVVTAPSWGVWAEIENGEVISRGETLAAIDALVTT